MAIKVYRMQIFKSWRGLTSIIGGALLLQIIAFYNSYPLVYSDTGTYIYSGFDFFVPKDRPILYGLFIRFFSWKESLWIVVFFQNLITAFILYRVMQLFIKRNFTSIYFLCIGILVFGSSIGWFSNQIMPDFFAPVLILTWVWVLLDEHLTWPSFLVAFILIIVANCSHFSHLLVSSLLLVILLLAKYVFGKRSFFSHFQLNNQKALFFILVVIASWVTLPGINASIGGKYELSKGSHVFLLAHLNEKGLLKEILDDYCGSPELEFCSLCEDKDNLPINIDQFIWSGDFLERHGGWDESKSSFDKIINLSLKKPKYLAHNLLYSTLYGVIQLTHIETGEGLTPYIEHSAPYGQIAWRFPHELNSYLNAKQNKFNGVELTFNRLNMLHILLIFTSFLLLILVLINQKRLALPKSHLAFIYFILISVFCNSLVTAGLSAPYTRYQSRVVWLLPFVAFIMLYLYRSKIKKIVPKNE